MTNLRYDIGAFKRLKLLLDEFATCKSVLAVDFIEGKLDDVETPVDEDLARMFLKACRVKNFLASTKTYYMEHQNESYQTQYAKLKLESFEVLLYATIFELDDNNYQNLLPFLDTLSPLSMKVLHFLKDDEQVCKIIQIACQYFDNEYIIENIINPLKSNKNLLECLCKNVKDTKKNRVEKKPCTIPKPPIFNNYKKCPRPPPPTPEIPKHFTASKAPKTTKHPPLKITRELEIAKSENYQRALNLIEIARKNTFNCAIIKQKPEAQFPQPPAQLKPKPCPKFAKIHIKPTQSSLRREAAILAKERDEEIKNIEKLISGACDPTNLQNLEDSLLLTREQERLQELERKHLQGLLTYEEAILAKKKLLKSNQLKYEEAQIERAKLTQEISELKQAEMEKNKVLVEKAQAIEVAAREAEKKTAEEKRCNAKMVDYETKALLQEAVKAREEEFEKKLCLIQEIRAIQQFNLATYVRDFDRTECANLGLLNEMSIAELQERLGLLKLKMREELEERRERINQEKLKRERELDEMRVFVEEARKCKLKEIARGAEVKVVAKRGKDQCGVLEAKDSDEILKLREKLQKARDMRMGLDV